MHDQIGSRLQIFDGSHVHGALVTAESADEPSLGQSILWLDQ